MGIVRAWATHKRWSNSEIEVLREHYATAEMNLLEEGDSKSQSGQARLN